MRFMIADTFQKSLTSLDAADQDRIKQAAFDFQMNPAQPGKKFHRLDKMRDKRFWSFRVSDDLRIIVFKDGADHMLCYANHHDPAYRWAENRQFEPNPGTGAMQLVEIHERVEEVVKRITKEVPVEPPLFAHHQADYLLGLGVPQRWLEAVQQVGVNGFLELIDHLPEEASENLLKLSQGQAICLPEATTDSDPFAHPDAQRRFQVVGQNQPLLRQALEQPLQRWLVFLHPSQREAVTRHYRGPAKISGGAGTGKTVVALHRAAHIARQNEGARILLTTFSKTLAKRLEQHLDLLLEPGTPERERITVEHLHRLAKRLFETRTGRSFRPLDDQELVPRLERWKRQVRESASTAFLQHEWRNVIDRHGIRDLREYLRVKRVGAGRPLQQAERIRLWKIFGPLLGELETDNLLSFDRLCHQTARALDKGGAPFDHVIADEVQDFGPAELELLRALAPAADNDLFLAGDVGQRIYRTGWSYSRSGIEVRGRSTILRLNYRTTEQIRRYADGLLPGVLTGDDDEAESRDTVSLLKGPQPDIVDFLDPNDEAQHLAERLERWCAAGLDPSDIAIFARARALLEQRAQLAVELADLPAQTLSDEAPPEQGAVALGTMHRAKGLEFRVVVVLGAEADQLPFRATLLSYQDDVSREQFRERERNLYYVACTRAREQLVVTHVGLPSEFLGTVQ